MDNSAYSTFVVDGNSFPTQIFIFSILSLHCSTSGFVIRIFRTIEQGITRVIHGKMVLGGLWGSVAHTLSLVVLPSIQYEANNTSLYVEDILTSNGVISGADVWVDLVVTLGECSMVRKTRNRGENIILGTLYLGPEWDLSRAVLYY